MIISRKPLPNPGDERIVRKFALFPTRVGDDILWLGYYDSHQFFGRRYRVWIEEFKTRVVR